LVNLVIIFVYEVKHKSYFHIRSLKENFCSLEATLNYFSTCEIDELFSALLVVMIVEETTETDGWFLLVLIIGLLSNLTLIFYYRIVSFFKKCIIYHVIIILKIHILKSK
jgi:hypothetical protein